MPELQTFNHRSQESSAWAPYTDTTGRQHKLIPALPFCHISLKGKKPLPEAYPQGDHLRKRRLDLKLLQKEVALILGGEEATTWNWENNRSSPKLHNIPKIVEFLGYVPFDGKPKTLGKRIIHYRRLYGITQKELAHRLGADPNHPCPMGEK